MSESKRSLGLMLEYLETGGHLSSGAVARARARLDRPAGGTHWAIQGVMAGGAWIAALLGALFVLVWTGFDTRHPMLMACGAAIGAIGLMAHHDGGQTFQRQLARALMMAGELLVLTTFYDFHGAASITGAAAGVWVIFHILRADSVTRFLSTCVLIAAATCCEPDLPWALLTPVSGGCGIGAIAYFTAASPPRVFAPAAYACALALPFVIGVQASRSLWFADAAGLVERCVMLIVLLRTIAVARCAAGAGGKGGVAALAAAGLITATGTPGLIASVALLIAGHARQDRVLTGIGGLSLPLFLCLYYHDLHLTLAAKSLALIASGVVLLTGRLVLVRGGSR